MVSTRRCFSYCLIFAVAFLFLYSCKRDSHAKDESQEQEFSEISEEIESGDYSAAGSAAKQAWMRQPDTLWGWRFKAQYALTQLILHNSGKADKLLKADLPARFSPLEPRYQYLRAYLAYRRDSSSLDQLKSAIESAKQQNDFTTEVDGILLLLSVGESRKPQGRELARRSLSLSRENHLAFQEAVSLSKLGTIELYHDRYADAIPLLLEAIPKCARYRYLDVQTRANLAECYFHLGDLDKALRSFKDLAVRLRAEDPPVLRATVYNQFGTLYYVRQDYVQAVECFRQAFKSAELLEPTNNSYMHSAINLSEALIQLGTPSSLAEAERFTELAKKGLATALRLVPPPSADLIAESQLGRADIAAAQGRLTDSEALYSDVLRIVKQAPNDPIRWAAYAGMAEVDERAGRMSDARRNFENAVSTIESNRSSQKAAQYQITFLASLIQFYEQYVNFLIRQHQAALALAVADSSRASVLTQGLMSSRNEPGLRTRPKGSSGIELCSFVFLDCARCFSLVGFLPWRTRFYNAAART